MRVAFPHMGHIHAGLRSIFRKLDIEVVVPPSTTKRTLSLGVRHSPETVCLPFKITLGNLMEALENGADTLVMPGGRGLCRFGYYALLQEQILRDLGYDFEMVRVDLFGDKIVGVGQLMRHLSGGAPLRHVMAAVRFGLGKLAVLDDIERVVHKVRAVEVEKGTASRVFKEAINAVDEANDGAAVRKAKAHYIQKLRDIPADSGAQPLSVGVMGEFYVILEPFSNMDVEIELGKLGVEVKRAIFVSEWTKFSLFLNAFGITEKEKIHKAAQPYLKRDVGGDGWETVGEKALHAGEYDGLVHLAPFTCMPEIIAMNIMPSIKADIPVLSLICDEQMGRAGMLTRLEAFVDLLKRRRAQRAGKAFSRVG